MRIAALSDPKVARDPIGPGPARQAKSPLTGRGASDSLVSQKLQKRLKSKQLHWQPCLSRRIDAKALSSAAANLCLEHIKPKQIRTTALAYLADPQRSEDFASAGCMGLAAACLRASGMAIIGTALAPNKVARLIKTLARAVR